MARGTDRAPSASTSWPHPAETRPKVMEPAPRATPKFREIPWFRQAMPRAEHRGMSSCTSTMSRP